MPRPLFWLPASAACALVAAAACSETKEEPTARPDAGTDAPGGNVDATGTEDATPGPSFCATLTTQPFFCADFDDGSALSDIFTTAVGGTIDTAEAKSKPGALKIVSDGTKEAFVAHEIEPTPAWMSEELAFSVRVEALGADARLVLARLGQHQTDRECLAEIELAAGGEVTLRGSGQKTAVATKKLATKTWTRVALSAESGADGGNMVAKLSFDGTSVIAAPVDIGCARFPGPPRFSFGVIAGAANAELRFDDVVIDGK